MAPSDRFVARTSHRDGRWMSSRRGQRHKVNRPLASQDSARSLTASRAAAAHLVSSHQALASICSAQDDA